ncbi:hypothetical protein [Glaciecola sp. SC05]|uniref:hypothetical protein n=1 Tax=Glaciecola sp. SC05 TaxID=1987355 RepID=UPI0035274C0D
MQYRIWPVLVLLLLAAPAYSQEDEWAMDDWGEEAAPESPFSGFVELALGARLRSDPAISTDKTLADLRAQLQWDRDFEHSRLKLTADLYYDGVLDQTRMQIRELAWQGSLASFGKWGEQFDVKVGQQVLTWGTGDYVFLNDLFPKDFQSFFAGRDDDYLKAPSLSAKVSGFFDWANVDFVVTPEFTPDNYINGDYFSFFSPFAGVNVAPGFDVTPPLRPQNPEYAMRIYKSMGAVEYALYGYRGFHKSPSSFTAFGEPRFSELAVYGASAITTFASGLLNAEVAYYDSLEDKSGNDPLVPNSQTRWLLGYEQELIKNLTGSAQVYVERTLDYDALQTASLNTAFEPNKNRVVFTQRLMYRALQQTLTLNLFNFYSTSDEDGYLKINADYSPVDQWQLSAGVNLFYGDQPFSFFNQFADASNAFVRFKYYY